jgi:hypothetical protein
MHMLVSASDTAVPALSAHNWRGFKGGQFGRHGKEGVQCSVCLKVVSAEWMDYSLLCRYHAWPHAIPSQALAIDHVSVTLAPVAFSLIKSSVNLTLSASLCLT